jgi:hypothetical protein
MDWQQQEPPQSGIASTSPDKKPLRNIFLIIAVVLGVLLTCTFPWNVMWLVYSFERIDKPMNKQGEFPFRIVYEIDGFQTVIEDTLICEYKGTGINEGVGKHLVWNAYLKSDKNDKGGQLWSAGIDDRFLSYKQSRIQYGLTDCALVLHLIDNDAPDSVKLLPDRDESVPWHSILIDIGGPLYYLGYFDFGEYQPGATLLFDRRDLIDENKLYEEYGIVIVEAKFSTPLRGNNIITEGYLRENDRIDSELDGVAGTYKISLSAEKFAMMKISESNSPSDCDVILELDEYGKGRIAVYDERYLDSPPKSQAFDLRWDGRIEAVKESGSSSDSEYDSFIVRIAFPRVINQMYHPPSFSYANSYRFSRAPDRDGHFSYRFLQNENKSAIAWQIVEVENPAFEVVAIKLDTD